MTWWKRIVNIFRSSSRKRELLNEVVNLIRDGQYDEALEMIDDYSIRACDDNRCLLMYASVIGNETITRRLIDYGYEVNVLYDHLGQTPLTMAVISGHTATVEVLLEANADIYLANAEGKNPLQMVFNQYMDSAGPELIRLFIGALEREAMSPERLVDKLLAQRCNLYCATYFKDVRIVECMLQRGFNVNSRSPRGKTALHLAAEYGDAAMAKLLIDHGALVNVMDQAGNSPLLNAAQQADKDVMKLLLEAGADPNVKSRYLQWSPTNCICRALSDVPREVMDECLELLLQHGVVFDDWSSFLEDLMFLHTDKKKIYMLMNYLALDRELGGAATQAITLDGLSWHQQAVLVSQHCLAFRISESIVFELLTDSDESMKNHVRNTDLRPEFQEFISNERNKRLFPYYCNTMAKRISKAEHAVELEDAGILVISKIMQGNINLCYIAARRIISHLAEKDLQTLYNMLRNN